MIGAIVFGGLAIALAPVVVYLWNKYYDKLK